MSLYIYEIQTKTLSKIIRNLYYKRTNVERNYTNTMYHIIECQHVSIRDTFGLVPKILDGHPFFSRELHLFSKVSQGNVSIDSKLTAFDHSPQSVIGAGMQLPNVMHGLAIYYELMRCFLEFFQYQK